MNSFLLAEDGSFILLETGYKIILDESIVYSKIQLRKSIYKERAGIVDD